MKNIFSFALLIFITVASQAAPVQWGWAMGQALTRDYGNSIAVDNSGNVYTTGHFEYNIDCDPNLAITNIIQYINGASFVHKTDNAGNVVMVKQFGGTTAVGKSIKLDALGNIYVAGTFESIADFDPGPGVYNLTPFGNEDAFVVKLDNLGNFLWAKNIGSVITDLTSMAVDANNNVIMTGKFVNTIDFDPGPATFNLTSTAYDFYVWKLDGNGDFQWAISIGGAGNDFCNSVAADNTGNVYTTGYYAQTADFDPGPGVYNLTATGNGNINAFILKLDNAGNLIWAKQTEGSNTEQGKVIAVDGSNNVFTFGAFYSGPSDFDPGPGVYNLSAIGNNGNDALYILKLDGNGDFVWAKQLQGDQWNPLDQFASAMTLDNMGNVYTTSVFSGTADFDPGPAVYNLVTPAPNNRDLFISKLDNNGNFQWAKQIGKTSNEEFASSIIVDANDYVYTTGYFETIVDFDPGVAVYNLMCVGVPGNMGDMFVHKYQYCGTNYNVNYDACDSITLFGVTYTQAADIVQPFADVNGCDSNLNMHIQIHTATYATVSITACNSYTLNGQTYTSSGTYLQTIPNAFGCDSIVTLNLTINTVNAGVTQTGPNFSAVANGAVYQWLSCNPFQEIIGETNQNFTAVANGDYALKITQNGCTDTSACYTVIGVNINENDISNSVNLFPNPVTDNLNIRYHFANNKNAVVQITDILGRVVMHIDLPENANLISVSMRGLQPGVYAYKCLNDDVMIKTGKVILK